MSREDCKAAGHKVVQGMPWVGTICLTCQPRHADPCLKCRSPRYDCCC